MTDTEINIAIAEACGWTNMFTFNDTGKPFTVGYPPDAQGRSEYISSQCSPQIPNYVGSLDAMHEAEKIFNPLSFEAQFEAGDSFNHKWREYATLLVDICDKVGTSAYHATAAQRAEAFLKTVEKWQ